MEGELGRDVSYTYRLKVNVRCLVYASRCSYSLKV